MEFVKKYYILLSILVLMTLRLFFFIEWFASVAIAGLLVALFDIIIKFRNEYKKSPIIKEKTSFSIIFLTLTIIGAIMLILLITNLVQPITWLNSQLFLDELSLLTLLLCLSQETILSLLKIITKKISRR